MEDGKGPATPNPDPSRSMERMSEQTELRTGVCGDLVSAQHRIQSEEEADKAVRAAEVHQGPESQQD